MIEKIRLSILILVIFLIVGYTYQEVKADYAPEKIGLLDDEARQELRLEPRSFIPHPRPNRRADVSINDQSKVLTPEKDEPAKKQDGSGGHEEGEEVVKDDEGSSAGSGEESISLGSHEEANAQKQRNVLSAGSLAEEHMKNFSSPVVIHSPDSKVMSTEKENKSMPLVTPHVTENTSAENVTRADGKENTVPEENDKVGNENPEVDDDKDDKVSNGDAHQEGSSTDDSRDEEPEKDGGSNKEDVGDALKLGLKSAKSPKNDEIDAEEDKDNDDGTEESGSGIGDQDETKSSKLDDEEKGEKPEDKNAETEVKHPEQNEKKIKDDNDDDNDNDDDDDDDDDNVNKEDDDHDNNSGSGDLPTKQTENTHNISNVGSTTPASQGPLSIGTNNIEKTTENDEDELGEDDDEDNKKEDNMEDAIKNENEEADEDDDEDEENESKIEIKQPKELEPEMTTGANQLMSQQSTVHKLPNKNTSNVKSSSKETPLQTPQQQIHQLSTIHKVKHTEKLENETQKARKIFVQHGPLHSAAVHTVKNVKNSEALVKKQTKKLVKQAKVAKATQHKHNVNLKHHEVKHEDKSRKNPRKSKPLLKYIHRSSLHDKKRAGAKLNKTSPHKCMHSSNIKNGYSLKGGTRAGHVEDLGESAGMHECIQRCCHKKVCDVALMLDGRCFGVACYSKELCKPVMVPHPHYVSSQIAFLDRAQRRDEVEGTRPEFDCKYGELTIRNNHRWSGELCGGVVTCRNGIVTVEKCPAVPPKPADCAKPKLEVQQRPGQCCIKKWICKDKSCEFGGRRIPHGVSLSDQLCTGVVKCMNGHLQIKECPKLPEKPTSCAHPKLKITTIPGQCCKKRWVCPDKSCSFGELKVDDGERLTDASCAVVMECKNGFLNFNQCPDPPAVPSNCLNPTLKVKRILGECCHRKWACAQEEK